MKLCDEQATRAAIIQGFRGHLGAAGPDDVALFWFSGHGSTGRLPFEFRFTENSGMCQTTVCHDSRAGAPDLYDKELAVLVREVVANGALLVSIQDSCHSRSGLRGDPPTGRAPRLAPAAEEQPTPADLLPELVRDVAGGSNTAIGVHAPRHVALSACNEWELANEDLFTDGVHGVFSEALVHALGRLGRHATYRQLFHDARCRVEGRFGRQVPTIEAAGDDADREFLGGTMHPRAGQVTMRHLRGAWEVDLGAIHGVVAESRLAVHGTDPLREVRVAEVHPERGIVEPIGWTPETERQYEMVLTDMPMPPVAVVIHARDDVTRRLVAAVNAAGPARRRSPHLRVVPPGDERAGGLVLRVTQAEDGRTMEITSSDHEPLVPKVGVDDQAITRTVRDLEHIARWLQVRNLANPSPVLADAVRIEVVSAAPGADPSPSAGPVEFAYTWNGTAWEPPLVFVRLHNTSDRKLFCVLLDLTDRYRMHADLFQGAFVAARHTVQAGGAEPIVLSLPPDRVRQPGAAGTDWLVLLVAEKEFSADAFALPRLGEVPRGAVRGGGITGILGRLGLRAVHRDFDVAPQAALDWSVTVAEVRTVIPAAAP
ncbi:hypothetical protein Asi02nite_67740 [Asanoa siamensis]|uniref:Peptidase C14 caspase domain-containing protein n=2 Tax=Asanoa siamensis TaxID=926357 RepID=A0ABQ4D177_9ACTN|nr:hypothetical protein Asi02nite_67740 [Asanoa siamensis]